MAEEIREMDPNDLEGEWVWLVSGNFDNYFGGTVKKKSNGFSYVIDTWGYEEILTTGAIVLPDVGSLDNQIKIKYQSES